MTGNMTACPVPMNAMNALESHVHAIFSGIPKLFSSDSHLAFSFHFIVAAEPPIIATGIKPNIPTTSAVNNSTPHGVDTAYGWLAFIVSLLVSTALVFSFLRI